MTSQLQAALVGYGLGGGTFHAPLISVTPALRLAAVVTRDAQRRRAAQEKYPDAQIVDTVEDLPALRPAIDLLAISSPSGSHAALARAGLAAGMHVVVDKPFAATAAEAREIGALAARMGKLAIPFQNRRWDGDFLTVSRLLREGTLGTVGRFESRFERWRHVPKPRWCEPDGRARAEGIIYDIGSHLIDQALCLFGPVRELYAECDRRRAPVLVEDDAFLALRHENGVRSHLYMSGSAQQSGPRMSVWGSTGGYVKFGLDPQEALLSAGGNPCAADWAEESPDRWGTITVDGSATPLRTEQGQYSAFYAGVARAIITGSPPPVDLATVIAGLEIIEAAFVSCDSGTAVRMSASAS
jgi:scyllo-inositol 2-dehydrogenase (NADP+)